MKHLNLHQFITDDFYGGPKITTSSLHTRFVHSFAYFWLMFAFCVAKYTMELLYLNSYDLHIRNVNLVNVVVTLNSQHRTESDTTDGCVFCAHIWILLGNLRLVKLISHLVNVM